MGRGGGVVWELVLVSDGTSSCLSVPIRVLRSVAHLGGSMGYWFSERLDLMSNLDLQGRL